LGSGPRLPCRLRATLEEAIFLSPNTQRSPINNKMCHTIRLADFVNNHQLDSHGVVQTVGKTFTDFAHENEFSPDDTTNNRQI
jgi:hypothetical protein